MPTAPNIYVPGTCNIGPDEIKKRVAGGWIGLVVTLLLGALLIYVHAPLWTRLFIFLPVAFSALGFLQAAFHFCVAYGTKGLFNVSNEAGKTETVSQQEFRKLDQKKAILIITYSLVIAIVVALAFFFL